MTTTEQSGWRVRSNHPTTAAGAHVQPWVPIRREIGITPDGRAGTVRAPDGKVLCKILRQDGWSSEIVLFFPADFERARIRKLLLPPQPQPLLKENAK